MDLKIIEPIQKPLHEFETPDEFNIYYHKHKDEMDKETTHLLNKKFSIDGYRIILNENFTHRVSDCKTQGG